MAEFIKGIDLCRSFFFEVAKPIFDKHYPELKYTAGLIGYGSDVLGYDDAVSSDHMWGPRFYMFLNEKDIHLRDAITDTLGWNLPYVYKGYSVHFSEPDMNDNGVRHAQFITEGKVKPIIFIHTFAEFLENSLGSSDIENWEELDWLKFSEHRLLSISHGHLFRDDLNIQKRLDQMMFYPEAVRRYLIASDWDIIASEQAFIKRTADVGDEAGSIIICARIAERLMRLCFLYQKKYAPYSKWFGTAFSKLDISQEIKDAINKALHAATIEQREEQIVKAQALVAQLHNESGITEPVEYRIETYFSRNIKVIYADKFSEAVGETLKGTVFEDMPLIGSFSSMGNLSEFSDNKEYFGIIKGIYKKERG